MDTLDDETRVIGVIVLPNHQCTQCTLHDFRHRIGGRELRVVSVPRFDSWSISMLIPEPDASAPDGALNRVATSLLRHGRGDEAAHTRIDGPAFLFDAQTPLSVERMRDVRAALRSAQGEQCRVCAHAYALKRCTGCHTVCYCSPACQRRDWRRHRGHCGGGGGASAGDTTA